MSVIDEAIKISYQLFPDSYKTKKKTFHFAFLAQRNKILSIGQNDPNKESNKALKFAKRFKTETVFPFQHAEIDAISKMWGKQLITSDMKLIVLRLNSYGTMQNSKPCLNCSKVINGLGLKKVYWSTKDGNVIGGDGL